MANAGLGYTPTGGGQAGLNEPTTMRDRQELVSSMINQGYSMDAINNALGIRPSAAVDPVDVSDPGTIENVLRGAARGIVLDPLQGLSEGLYVPETAGALDDASRVASGAIGGLADLLTGEGHEAWEQRLAEENAENGFGGKLRNAIETEVADVGLGMAASVASGGAATPVLAAHNYARALQESAQTQLQQEFGGDEKAYKKARRDNPELYGRLQMSAAATAALETVADYIPVLKGPGAELFKEAAKKSVAKAAARSGGKIGRQALVEAVTELTQTVQNMTINDPDVRNKLTSGDLEGAYNTLIEKHGEELQLSAAAGGLLGGGVRGATLPIDARQEKKQQEEMDTKTKALEDLSDEHGLNQEARQQILADPEQRPEFIKDMAAIEDFESTAKMMEQQVGKAENDVEKAEYQKVAKAARANADKAKDKVFKKHGGMTVAEVKTAQTNDFNNRKTQAQQQLAQVAPDEKFSAPMIDVGDKAKMEQYEEQVSEYASARAARVDLENQTPISERRKTKKAEKLKEAREAEASARANLSQNFEKDGDYEATHQRVMGELLSPAKNDEFEGAVEGILDRRYRTNPETGAPLSEAVIRRRAEGVIAKGDKKRVERITKLNEEIEALEDQLVDADAADVEKIEKKIANKEAQREGNKPAYVAARRALQALDGDLPAEAQVTPEDGAEAEGTPAQQPESADKANKEPEGEAQTASEAPAAEAEAPPVSKLTEDTGQALTVARAAMRAAPEGDIAARQDAEQAAEAVLKETGRDVSPANVKKLLADSKTGWKNDLNKMKAKPKPKPKPKPKASQAEARQLRDAAQTVVNDISSGKPVSTASRNKLLLQAKKAGRKGVTPDNIEAYANEILAKPEPKATVEADSPLLEGQAVNGIPWTPLVEEVGADATLESAEAYLKERTQDTMQEVSASFDADGNLLGAGTNSHDNSVSIPLNNWDAPGVTMTHTHPYKTPLSYGDAKLLSEMGEGAKIRAVLPDQTIEMVKLKPYTHEDVARASDAVTDQMEAMEKAGSMVPPATDVARARIAQEAQTQLLEHMGLVDYTQPMAGFTPQERNTIDAIVENAINDAGLSPDVGAGTAEVAGRSGGAKRSAAEAPLAAGTNAAYPEFRAAWQAGEPVETLQQRPEFQQAVGVMMTKPATSRQPGFDSAAWHRDRVYTIDGQAVTGTDAAIDQFVLGAKELAAKETGKPIKPITNGRQLTIITGPPASGKSTIANEIAYDQGAAIIDSDEYKKALPEFGRGEGANAVHKESKGLAQSVEAMLTAEGANIVYPKVGHEQGSLDQLAQAFKEQGYTVRFVDLKVPREEAMRRMLGRFGSSGRLIPPNYLLDEVGDNPSIVHQQMAQEGAYDGYAQLDGLTPYGTPPAVLSQSGGADPLAGTAFEVPGGYSPQRGQGAAQPGAAGDTGPQAARGLDLFRTADEPTPKDEGGIAADPEVLTSFAQNFKDATLKASAAAPGNRKSALAVMLKNGDLTVDQLADGLNRAVQSISSEGSEASTVVWTTARQMFPNLPLNKEDFIKGRKENKKTGKTTYQLGFPKEWQDKINAAFQFLNSVGETEGIQFEKENEWIDRKGVGHVKPLHYKITPKMQRAMGIKPPKRNEFTLPMRDPNNTDAIVRTPQTNRMSEGALAAMRDTARELQSNVYKLDHDAIAKLTPDDLISNKQFGQMKLKRGDIAGIDMWPDAEGNLPPNLPVTDTQARILNTQRYRAGNRLKTFRALAEKHGDADIGFRYRVDDKGRIAADGQFSPQTGDWVKKVLIVQNGGNPMPMANMPTTDHAASGWQVSVGLTKDATGARNFNMVPDSALQEGYKKNDLYTTMMNEVQAKIESDAAAGHDLARLFKERIFDANVPWGKNQIKGSVIAVNYGAQQSKFMQDFQGLYRDYFSDVPAEDMSGMWNYVAAKAYSNLNEKAPKALAFQRWAIKAIGDLVSKVEKPDGEPLLEFTVGMDTAFSKKKLAEKDLKMVARDTNKFGVEQTVTVKLPEVDAAATARSIFSQIIQGFDASILHEGVKTYKANGGGFVTTNHDSYTTPEGTAGQVAAAARDAMASVLTKAGDIPARLRQEIIAQAEKHDVELDPDLINNPELFDDNGAFIDGGYDLEDIKTSVPTFVEDVLVDGKRVEVPPAYTDLSGELMPNAPAFPTAARGISDVADKLGLSPSQTALINPIYQGNIPPKSLRSNKSSAKWLEQNFKETQDRAPTVDFTKPLSAEEKTEIAGVMASEVMLGLEATGNAGNWYSSAMEDALDIAAVKWPMLRDDAAAEAAGFGNAQNARSAMTYIMAVTSQNLDVSANVVATNAAFTEFVDIVANGGWQMKESWGTGDKQKAMGANFAKFKPLMDAMPGDAFPEKMAALDLIFRDKMTVSEWVQEMKAAGIPYTAPSGTLSDTVVYGSSLLGPKIGNGFWQNLNKNFQPITIDLWMRRTWGRMTGKSIGNEMSMPEQRARMKASAQRSWSGGANTDALMPIYRERRALVQARNAEKLRTDGTKKERNERVRVLTAQIKQLDEVAADIRNIKISEPWKKEYDTDNDAMIAYALRVLKPWDKAFKEANDKLPKGITPPGKMQPTWARAAKRIKADNTTPLDQVQNGTQRRQIEDTMHEALGMLRNAGVDVTPADMQAILWYPEKDLWDNLKSKNPVDEDGNPVITASPLNESYDGAFTKVFEKEGIDVNQAKAVTGGAQPSGGGRGTGGANPAGDAGAVGAEGTQVSGGTGAQTAGQEPVTTPTPARGASMSPGLRSMIGQPTLQDSMGPGGQVRLKSLSDLDMYDRNDTSKMLPKAIEKALMANDRPADALNNLRHNFTEYDVESTLSQLVDKGRNGSAYKEAAQKAYDMMQGMIDRAPWSRLNPKHISRKAGLEAAAERFLKSKTGSSFQPMNQKMADNILTDMGVMLAGGEMTAADIGNAMNVSRSRANEIAQKALAKARPTPARGINVHESLDLGTVKGDMQRAKEVYSAVVNTAKNPVEFTASKMNWIEDNIFNRFAPVRRLEMAVRKAKGLGETLDVGMDSAFKAMETAVNDSGRNETLLMYGAAKKGTHGEFGTAAGTKGLKPIFDMVTEGLPEASKGQAMADWMAYLVANRISELRSKGNTMSFPMSDADVQAHMASATPQMKAAQNEWRKHNEANIDFLVDTGRITKDQADAMKDTGGYVPFYRTDANVDGSSPEFELNPKTFGPGGGKSALARDPGIKALKGGDKKAIDNLMTNMIRNSQAMVAAGMRNDAANKTFDLMKEAGMARAVPGKPSKKPTANSVPVWINGKKKWVDVNEAGEPVMMAMAGLTPVQLGRIGKLMAGVSGVFRQGITLSPAFMIRNAIRGAVSTGLLSGGANLTVANNTLTGFRDAYNNGQATQALKAQSGMGDYNFGNQTSGMGKDDLLMDYGIAPKTVGYRIRKAVAKAEHVGSATELADRVALYNTLIANGVRADEAAYQARAVMDYARHGGSAELQAWLPLVPFLNARLQGFSRLTEGAFKAGGAPGTARGLGAVSRKQALAQLALHGGVLMALSGAIWALNSFDEEKEERYKQEPLYRRLNYHIVYVGDKTVLIPKAFELGHIFSSIPELFGDAMTRDMNEIGPGIKKIIADTVMFNAIPAAVQPIIESQANYSFFRGAPIEGRREQSMKPRDRVQGTSTLSRFVGQQLGISDLTKVSPTMIEHFFQGYGGTYFLTAASAMDVAAAELGIGSAPVGGAFGDVPLASSAMQRAFGSMLKETDQASSKYMEEFYRNKDYITQIHRSAKAAAARGDVEYAQKLLDEAGGTPAAYKLVNKAGYRLGKINSAIRDVRADPSMTPNQKRTKIAPLIKARNDLVRGVANVIKKIEEKQGTTFKSAA